jgi:hypothetical protein
MRLAAGEFYEVKCHEGPVARLRVSYDDFLLVSAGEDGSVVLLDIRDKELAKASSRQQQVRVADRLTGSCPDVDTISEASSIGCGGCKWGWSITKASTTSGLRSLLVCAGCLQEKLPWSEEVLVSKSELEERRNHVAELEQQVAELTMQTEYQLRLKELHLQVRQGRAAVC